MISRKFLSAFVVLSFLATNASVQVFLSFDPPAFTTYKTYNSDMELTAVTYPNGNGVEYTYDSSNANVMAHGNLLTIRRMKVKS